MSPIDRLVDALANVLDRLGFNGVRLRWRWSRRRGDLSAAAAGASALSRSVSSPHKMCPVCRALVPRAARKCTECGVGLARVRAPGIGRLVSAILPGGTAVTGLLVLVNGLFFLLVLLVPTESAVPGGFSRLLRADSTVLLRYGAGWGPLVFELGEWWRLVTPIFLHGGLLHFVFNTMVLMQLGPLVEEEYGTERFMVVYLLSGITGNLASQFFGNRPTVGASSAIMGLMGLLLVYGFRRGGVFGQSLRTAMSRYAIYVLIFSLLPGVDLLSHAGGFLGGCGLGLVVPVGPFRSRATERLWESLALAAVAGALLCFYLAARFGGEAVRLLGAHG